MAAPKNSSRDEAVRTLTSRTMPKAPVPERLKRPRKIAQPCDLPGVVVRIKSAGDPITLMNIPQSELGADLILSLVGAYPEMYALTNELEHVRFGDIIRVDCPERGELLVADAKKTITANEGSFPYIQVSTGIESGGKTVGIRNIPDSSLGRLVLAEILNRFSTPDDPTIRRRRTSEMYEYTLYTTDSGHTPIRALAAANPSLR